MQLKNLEFQKQVILILVIIMDAVIFKSLKKMVSDVVQPVSYTHLRAHET